MKIFCFILSIYVLVLSTVPCCADDNCIDETKTEQSNQHSQEDHQDSCGTCSPFLTCGTCVGFTLTKFTLTFDTSKVFIKSVKMLPSYKNHFVKDLISKIWQPPKIS